MKVKEVTVTYGGKYNLGDYNSAHIEVTFGAELEEGDNHDEVAHALMADAQFEVRDRARELFQRRGAKVAEVFAGLPVEVQQQIKGGDTDGNHRTDG